MLELDPVNTSPLPAGIMFHFVHRGHYRREGLFFPVPCAFFLLVPVVNSNQWAKDTQFQWCTHLSKFHWHPRSSPGGLHHTPEDRVLESFVGTSGAGFPRVAPQQTSPPSRGLPSYPLQRGLNPSQGVKVLFQMCSSLEY